MWNKIRNIFQNLASWVAQFIERLATRSPLWVSLVVFLIGLGFCGASALVGIASYQFSLRDISGREVGFLAALNWSATFVIGFPVLAFLILSAVREADDILYKLVGNRMLVNANRNSISARRFSPFVKKSVMESAIVAMLVGVFVFGFLMVEWLFVSGIPLFTETLPNPMKQEHWFHELDWSVAALLTPTDPTALPPNRWVNFVFSFFAYLYLAVGMTFIFGFFVFIAGFAKLIADLSGSQSVLNLIPDPDSNDDRRGFELFEDLFKFTLNITFVGFVLLYLMRLQNLYLRTFEIAVDNGKHIKATHIDVFVFGDIKQGFQLMLSGEAEEIKAGLSALADSIFRTGILQDWQGWLAIFVVGFLFSLVLAVLIGTLRHAAKLSRQNLLNHVRSPKAKVTGFSALSRQKCLDRIDGKAMQVWPVRWPSLNELCSFLAFGFICLIFYKLGLIWLGIKMARSFLKAI